MLTLLLGGAMQAMGQNTCLAGWRYTKAVSMENYLFGILYDWQLKIEINTQVLVAAGKMRADGADIRFTTDDCCTQIPYWIQRGMNTDTTVIWVRVPQIASFGTTFIQMYYGNPSASVPVSNLDMVHFSIGNDSIGTDTATPGITVATQAYTVPINCSTVRFRVYSADTMAIRFKVTNDTNMVTGSSQFFNCASTPSFNNFDVELPVSGGGHFGWYTSTGGSFLNSCTPTLPCPGSCGDAVYKTADQGLFGALKNDTCGILPSMKLWYRRSAFFDPFSDATLPEFDRQQPFGVTASSGTVMCFNDSLPLGVANIGAVSYQWFYNGVAINGATDTTLQGQLAGNYHCVADFGVNCQSISSDTVALFYHTPEVNLGADLSVCSDTGYTVQAAGQYTSYTWNDGSTLSSLFIPNSGTVNVQVVDSLGCVDSDTVTITIHAIPVPVVTVVGPSSVCQGSTISLTAVDPQWYAYQWFPNVETSGNINVSASGNYAVIVWDQFFCSDTSAAVAVTVFPDPGLELGGPYSFCAGDSAILDAGNNWTDITWPDGSHNPQFTVYTTGYFRADILDSNGCADADTAIVQRFNNPTVDIGPSDTICENGTMTLDAGPAFTSYAWTNGATSQTVAVGPGVYNVSVIDTNNCAATSNIVYLSAYPSLALPVVSGSAAGLSSTTAPNYQWFLGTTAIAGATAQTYIPTVTGFYFVSVADPYGCGALASVPFQVILDIVAEDIPQGFSPNGDGINDRFEIKNMDQFPASSLIVMNRWGQQVFSQQPYQNAFNGVGSSGKDLPDGTYFYVLDLGNGQTFQDYLIINR